MEKGARSQESRTSTEHSMILQRNKKEKNLRKEMNPNSRKMQT